jgi:branched-chain amino acid transport system substrate-binding protein
MSIQWMQDSYSLSSATVRSLLAKGLDTWFFITVDYTFGKAWQADTAKVVTANGGKVLGSVLHPLKTTDFSTYLLKAQASGAKVIALANAGTDLANALKQAKEFGIGPDEGQTVVPLSININLVHSIGLTALQGAHLATSFYWDLNDDTRAFTARFRKAFRDRVPNKFQAATYDAVSHYLRSVKLAGTDDGLAVMKKMRETPVNDFDLKNVSIRADGQVLRPIYSAQIKTPTESKGPSDYYKITGTLPSEEIWRPASESRCDLMKK